MPEHGGPTTQSGILYQNSVAALFLGDLLDLSTRPAPQRVIKVRVEAPEDVDDTVVSFADDHCEFVQVKENVRAGDAAWRKLFGDFDKQFRRSSFQRGVDRLVLYVGEPHNEHRALQEMCERAGTSEHFAEWWGRLSQDQQSLVDRIKSLLDPTLLNDDTLLDFFKASKVVIWPLSFIERDVVRHRMPTSNVTSETLFSLLRDRVGGAGRRRDSFTAATLREDLQQTNNVELIDPPDIDELQRTTRECSALIRQHTATFGTTGGHAERAVVNEIVDWVGATTGENHVAMLLDQAGMGKTVVMRDSLCRLEELGYNVLAIKADLQLSETVSHDDLQRRLGFPEPIERAVARLAALGRVVVLIDQLDALSLSLARDEKVLNTTIELIGRLRLIPGVAILISCRTFDRKSDPRLSRIAIDKEFPLSELTDEEIGSVLNRVGVDIETLTPATRTLLRVPLHLDLFVRSIEGAALGFQADHGITSLQELYALLWHSVLLKTETNSPPVPERVEVIQRMVERMRQEQQTTVPDAMFDTPALIRLRPAITWLASVGVLVPGPADWSFLHQTFFDYCYARQFVEAGDRLTETVLHSTQGLLSRPHVVQVLSYLRGTNRVAYLRDLNGLLRADNLRFHLRDLVFRWFGSLPAPFDEEWTLAQRLLADTSKRHRLLRAMQGKLGWFSRINGPALQEFLAQDDATLDTEVIPYLDSLSEVAQREVAIILHPFVERNEQWNNRVVWVLSHIRRWQAEEALDLFEHVLQEVPTSAQNLLHEVDTIAKASPRHACRIVRLVFDRVLDEYIVKLNASASETDEDHLFGRSRLSLAQDLEALNSSMFHESLTSAAQAEPRLFLDLMLPWVRRVLELASHRDNWAYYDNDDLGAGLHHGTYVVLHDLIAALTAALTSLAQVDREAFRQAAQGLAALPLETPQHMLARVYRNVANLYSSDALAFLLGDQRRLMLGNRDQYESRKLIEAISPHLSDEQQVELENYVLNYMPIWKYRDTNGLRWWRLEQLYLLQAIPESSLTARGIDRLHELQRKFPNIRASDKQNTIEFVAVGPPISLENARQMSDKAWLRAMNHYQGDISHKDFGKGGARELSGILVTLVKEEPRRFFRLVEQVPDSVDDAYVEAFINGFAEATVPVEWFYTIVRRFNAQPDRDIQRTTAWAIEKRVTEGVPDDILDMLERLVTGPLAEDEMRWDEGDRDPYNSCLNSDRGSAFRTLVHALDQRGTAEAKERKWRLIEFAATDTSTALRAGAIEALLYILHEDRARAVGLFEQLMAGHSALLRSYFAREFVYYGFYRNLERMEPFIRSMMDDEMESVQQRGAELACITYISPAALESSTLEAATEELAQQAIHGTVAWRKGAARIYAHNLVDGPRDRCTRELSKLFDDEDQTVRRMVSDVIRTFRGEHIFSLGGFIETYADSRSLHSGLYDLATYLLEHGLRDPDWTLSIIQKILDNPYRDDDSRWLRGGEELIRLVTRIYNDPTIEGESQNQAMDVFDRLMERFTGQAYAVLEEWDRR
jgi:hypothetical protein